jgi:PAS domain S-box-containing protein
MEISKKIKTVGLGILLMLWAVMAYGQGGTNDGHPYVWKFFSVSGPLLILLIVVYVWNLKLRGTVKKKTEIILHREADLRESEENFRTFFETMNDMIFVGTPEGKIYYTNPAVSQKLGYTRQDLDGMHILDLHPSEKRSEAEEIFTAMFKRELDVCPLPLQTRNGMLIPVETRVWFGKWNGGDCVFGISKDLSKEQEALQKFDRFFRNNPTLMAVSTLPEKRFTDVNVAFLNTLGFTREEVIGKTSAELELFVEPEKQVMIAEMLQSTGHIIDCELKVKCRDGTILEGLFSGEIIESQGKRYFLTVMADQTKRRQAEAELRDSEERFRAIFNNSLDGIFFASPEGTILAANPAARQMLGRTESEIIEEGRELVVDVADPGIPKALEERARTGRFKGTINFKRKNGEIFPVELSSALFALGSGDVRASIIFRDITERLRGEEALKSALKEKDVLLREIHHRVKNNMQVISSLLSLQVDRVDNEQVRQILLESQQRVVAMAMVHETLYGGKSLSTVDLSGYVGKLVNHLKDLYGGHASIDIDLDIENVEWGVDQAVTCGLIINELITNAFKHAFPKGGKGRIHVRIRRIEDEEILLTVSDDGIGFKTEADPENPSTLGLRLVHGLLEHQLNGSLEMRVEAGTTFTLRWPNPSRKERVREQG